MFSFFKKCSARLYRYIKRLFNNKIKYKNVSFYIKKDNWITKYRHDTFSTKEPETLDWIDQNLRENDIFFDIGANIGIYSLYGASKKIKNCKFYTFEPEYSNLDQLKFNIIKNNLEEYIYPYSVAFSDLIKPSFLHIQNLTPGAALHTEAPTLHDEIIQKSIFKEGIITYSMDLFCQELNICPNLIKIDVDGGELKILKGSQKILTNINLRSIIIELDNINIKKECENILSDNSFNLISSFEKNKSQIWSR